MLADKVFKNALIVSVLFHAVLFLNWHAIHKRHPLTEDQKQIKLTYYSLKKQPPASRLIAKKQAKASITPGESGTREKKGTESQGMLAKKHITLKPVFDTKASDKIPIEPQEIMKDKDIKHIPSGPMLISYKDKDFSSEPVYLDYYNAVRGLIRKAANSDKPYYSMEGDIKIVFVLLRNGDLMDASVIADESSQNTVLRRHALMSIRKAAPFPPFHESMNEDSLTLRLTISFEK
jgi:outer membrane biosynthesis protein TonB